MKKNSVVIWNEHVHERENEAVRAVYPDGIHNAIASGLLAFDKEKSLDVSTATLEEVDHGLSEERLKGTDVLFWWGHCAHGKVRDEIAERVQCRVMEGMGLVVLHSGHFSKVFKRLMGTSCSLKWREAGERERIWVVNPGHPIAQGIEGCIELENTEMYGEPFGIPEPDEQVFISWFEGGEVFRSGCCWRRGAGKVFYFSPGHETYPIYHNETIHRVLFNAALWAASDQRWLGADECENVLVGDAREKIVKRGASIHEEGEAGFR